ncbi:ADP-glucose phosphorylase isoform X3 [Euphorbia lathyris]|uniref:ADP-glucose phosphorylase isoform X3 n=1 Tax=Euphorbia lathyris TaxID=212925 RepID=UPI003313DBA4
MSQTKDKTEKMASPSPIPSRSPEIRHDALTNRWVIFSPARAKRPTDFKSKSPHNPSANNTPCPFCIGHEHECAPEIFRVPSDPAWKIRVIENLYPALSRNLANPSQNNQCLELDCADRTLTGFGFHDVVIEAPVHSVQLVDMEPTEIGEVLLAYKKRIEQIMVFESIVYIQVFKNHGASAGASMSHSHSQIMALPIIPPSVSARLDGTKEYFEKMGKCCLCVVNMEKFLIDETTHFISIVPFAATYPFEIWIIPRDHSSHFHEVDSEMAVDLGTLLKLMLRKMCIQLNNPPFNFMIQTAPLQVN